MHFFSDLSRVLADGLKILFRNMPRRNDAGGVAGVNAGELDVLHDGGHEGMSTVADRVRLALHGIVEEAVDQDRAVRGDADRCRHIVRHLFIVVDDFHPASAQDVRGTHHDRITDLCGDLLGFLDGGRHTGLGHGNAQLVHHGAEVVAVLRQVDDSGGGTEDLHALFFQLGSEVQRRLSAELGDDADGLFLLIDREDILQGQGLEVELVRGIIVRGDSLGVAVDDDRLEAELSEGHGRMDAAVIELDTLADAVGAAAQDHDLGLVCADGVLVLPDISRIVVGAVLGPAHMDTFPALGAAKGLAGMADLILGDAEDLGQVVVGEAVLFGLDQSFIRGNPALEFFDKGFFFLDQFLHLLDKIVFDFCDRIDLVHGHALAEGFIHDEVAFGGDIDQELAQLVQRHLIEAVHMTEAEAALLQGPDRLLEGFLVGLADTHDFADRAHLGAKLVLDALEFFKCPAGKLDDDEIAGRNVFVQGAEAGVREIRQCEAGGQFG